ncbi:MAG TPA: hypothetical protein DCF62_00825, partial [Porticoccaceae bacterium]|nr:hypothetical protein [Porticoccaceae bacterium]
MKGFQSGAATLLITLILVVIGGLSALVLNKAVFNEQKLSGNDIRNKEVYAASSGALEFGVDWLQEAYLDLTASIPWDNVVDGVGQQGATASPPAFVSQGEVSPAGDSTIGKGVDTYTPSVTYTLLTDEDANPAFVEITATATAVNDSHITKTLRVIYLLSSVGTASLVDGPPLLVEDCIPNGAVTGTPDIYNQDIAIGTINGDASCIDQGHFDLSNDHPGAIGTMTTPGTIFQSLFGGLTEEGLALLSSFKPDTFIYVDSNYLGSAAQTTYHPGWNGNTWHDNVGSPEGGALPDQVVLYFDSSVGCPPINGSTIIYGLVYYETTNCPSPGWGGGIVYGTTAFEGDLNKFNANAELHDLTLDDFGDTEDSYRIASALP